MDNAIYEWVWFDNNGKHTTTVVGQAENADQSAYCTELARTGLIWDVSNTCIGEDI